MPSSLPDFITRLKNLGELQQLDAPVSTRLELAAIARKISSYPEGGPALLFHKPGDSPYPLAANLFGSRQRMQLALGVDHLSDLTGALAALLCDLPINGMAGFGRLMSTHPALRCCLPVVIPDGPCRETVERLVDLERYPFPHNWPDDGSAAGTGHYITLGQVFTNDPDGGNPNCGIYRCQIHGPQTLAIRWRQGSGAEQHLLQYRKQRTPMPVAIVLGGPPALTLTAAWPLPEGLDELQVAGWLRNSPIPVVHCPHGPLRVPAEAELVLEGFAEYDQELTEGPFGNHTGRYDPAGPAARVRITRITRRRSPIIPATVVGPPPQEDCWMMLGWERLLAALLPKLVPNVREVCLPQPWVFRQSAVIALEQHTPRVVREAVHQLWQLPWFRKARLLVLVDAATAPHNLQQVAWQVVNEADWLDDLIRDEAGGRLAIDATGRYTAAERLADEPTQHLIKQRWKEYGLP